MRLTILVLAIAIAAHAANAQPAAPATIAERAAFYDRLAREKSTTAIEQLVHDALAARPNAAPPYMIEALFERYFELDAAGAVRFASESGGAPVDVVQSLYARLAAGNPNAALAALSLVDDPQLAQLAATTIVRALGHDVATIELVAAALHAGSVDEFRANALTSIPEIPPREALAAALRLRDAARRDTATRAIVMRWAEVAPREAIQEAERVQDPALRSALRRVVLQSWRDTTSLLTYLKGLDADARRAALAEGVLFRLADADPERAAELAQSLPPGPERSAALQQIAAAYSQRDGAAAVKWAQGLDPPQPEVVQAVLRYVASRDALQAFDLAASLPEPARLQAYFAVIGSGARDPRQFEQLAGRVTSLPDGQNRQALLSSLLTSWAQSPGNAAPALEWALAHPAGLPEQVFTGLGYSLAQSDPDAAGAYLDRLPSAARAGWIGAMASGYLRSDWQRALAFVERFRGDSAYDGAAAMLIPQLASIDPPAAARLLASLTTRPPNSFGIEAQIGREWAQRDPQAAAQWALDLPPTQRSMAIAMIGQAWGQSNPGAVRSWALGLPAGDKRDQALAVALRAQGAGAPDPALLAAFSDDRQRQAALMPMIMMTAASDAPLARQLIEQHITDPRMRSQAQQMVDGAARGEVPLPTMGVVQSPAFGLGPPVRVFVAPNGVVTAPPLGMVPPPGIVPTSQTQSPSPSADRPAVRLAPPPGNTPRN